MTYKKIDYIKLNELYFVFDTSNRHLRKSLYQTNNNQDIKVICESAKETLDEIIKEVWDKGTPLINPDTKNEVEK